MPDRDQTGRRPRVVLEGDVERAAKHRRAVKRPADGFLFEQLALVLAVAAIVYAIAALTLYFSA